jgi:hypothetical protein
MSVVIWASVLDVDRELSRIATIAECLPDVDRAVRGDTPGTVILSGRGFGASRARYRLEHMPGRTDWELCGPVEYQGTMSIFGDVSVTQVRSTLTVTPDPQPPNAPVAHLRSLRELAHRIEAAHVARNRRPLLLGS